MKPQKDVEIFPGPFVSTTPQKDARSADTSDRAHLVSGHMVKLNGTPCYVLITFGHSFCYKQVSTSEGNLFLVEFILRWSGLPDMAHSVLR